MQTTARINVAIVGAGLMGRWHAHAAAKLGATVCAIIDADLSAAKRLAQRVGPNCESFANILDAHRTIDFQVLHICTPLATHADLAKQALALNKHLIVEKPLVASSAALRELQGIAPVSYTHLRAHET